MLAKIPSSSATTHQVMECLLTLNLTCFLCYGFYPSISLATKICPVCLHTRMINAAPYASTYYQYCKTLVSHISTAVLQMWTCLSHLLTIKMSTTQFWLLFTFLLITISLELALLIFKLDLWIQAWTLREQNLQEVLDLRQRWVQKLWSKCASHHHVVTKNVEKKPHNVNHCMN